MRKQFVACNDRKTALKRNPWAVKAAKVDGGFLLFESEDEYKAWKAQQ